MTHTLEILQREMTQAFKWMAKATQEAQQGDIPGAVYSMAIAMEYWMKCQHTQDKYLNDDENQKVEWKFFTNKAIAMAKQEINSEGE